jgi:hypothetical protein
MGKAIDTAIALRFLKILVTPFEQTDAYKLGIIDKEGHLLKDVDHLTSAEADAYTLLHRIVFKLKKLLGKLPMGKSMMASITAALMLVKEDVNESEFEELLEALVPLVTDEDIAIVKAIYEETGIASAGGVAMPDGSPDTNPPVRLKNNPYKKRNLKTQSMVRRKNIAEFIQK